MFQMGYKQTIAGGVWLLASLAARGQTLKVRTPETGKEEVRPAPPFPAPVKLEMSVPAGTPVKVALDAEVRIRQAGQPIHGKTIEPVYAFDQLLIPVGTTVVGKISGIDPVGKKRRTLDAMDGNFSPIRTVHVQFDELVMSTGAGFRSGRWHRRLQMECCALFLRMPSQKRRTRSKMPLPRR